MDLRRVVAIGILFLFTTACSQKDSDPPDTGWRYWLNEPQDGLEAHRIAMIHAEEGWSAEGSSKPQISMLYELYEGDRINVAMWGAREALEPGCITLGCYIYARNEGGSWKTFRLLPTADEWTYLGEPWGFRELIEQSSTIEIEFPFRGERRCLYTFNPIGYSRSLHESATPEMWDGRGEAMDLSEESEGHGDISESKPPNWVDWPTCAQ